MDLIVISIIQREISVSRMPNALQSANYKIYHKWVRATSIRLECISVNARTLPSDDLCINIRGCIALLLIYKRYYA